MSDCCNIWRTTAIVSFAVQILVGCGGSSVIAPNEPVAATLNDSSPAAERDVSLTKALSELEELSAPEGVDPTLFTQLKDSMEDLLRAQYKEDGTP